MAVKKVKIHQFSPIVYPFRLWITVTKDKEVLADRFHDGYNKKGLKTELISTSEALTFYVQQKQEPTYWGVLIVFTEKKNFSIKNIAHESTHAARFFWEHIGESPTGEEADAYLVGWIADCINQVKLNKFNGVEQTR